MKPYQEGVPPAIVIELAVEAAPRVLIRATMGAEEERLWYWISSQDALAELVIGALAEQERAT